MTISRAAWYGAATGAGAATLFVVVTFTYGALKDIGNRREGW